MKTSSVLKLALFLTITLGSVAHAGRTTRGVGSSGGGSAIVCRNADQTINHAEMYDLYEGKNYFGLTINPSPAEAPRAQIDRVVNQLSSVDYAPGLISQTVNLIISKMEFLPVDTVIAPPSDMGTDYPTIHPAACAVEGIGFYTTEGQLKVSQAVYNAFSNTDKAAFVLHEAIYLMARQLASAVNSEDSRYLNALLFSQSPATGDLKEFLDAVANPMWFKQGDYALVPGQTLSNYSVEISTPDQLGLNFIVDNISCGTSPRSDEDNRTAGVNSINGTAHFTMNDDPCYDLTAEIKLQSPYPPVMGSNGFNVPGPVYTVKVFHAGMLISTQTASLDNGYSTGFGLRFAHTQLPALPLP